MKRVSAPARLWFMPAVLLMACAPWLRGDCPQPSGASILPWVARVRQESGCQPVATDPILERAAAAYAAELAQRGVLSHRDREGRDALDRVQEAGGTSTLVGEILGSGIEAAEVATAWGASPAHRAVVENPLWTHVGTGCASRGVRQVWVVLFTARRISGLLIEALGNGETGAAFRVSGWLAAGKASSPVLLSGLLLLEPELWLPASGRFEYRIPPGRESLYHRLGFLDEEGALTITDAFFPEVATSSPETGPR